MAKAITIAMSKNAQLLALFAVACTAIVGIVHLLTKDEIEFQQQQKLLRNLNSIIADNSYNNVIYQDCLILPSAINIDGTVSGVRALKHQETPGLGDKIEIRKSEWIKRFSGKKLANQNDSRWQVKKDGGMFDQFTGATITPRAVVKAVRHTVNYFNSHKDELFESASNCNFETTGKESL